MSLIPCPECGHSVSSKASKCPECGVRIAGNVKRCPICNSYLLMNVEECPKCHTHFIVDTAPAPVKKSAITAEAPESAPREVEEEDFEEQDFEEQQPEQKPRKKSGGTPWFLIVIMVVLAGIGGGVYWLMYEDKQSRADEAYHYLENCNDPQNYEDFIARYPDSKHIGDVRARLSELRQEEEDWHKATLSARLPDFNAFLSAYPTSPRRQAALRYIDSLEWCEADTLGTSAAYNAYIQKHENGEYITQAFAARDTALRHEMAARRDSIARALADSLEQPSAPL